MNENLIHFDYLKKKTVRITFGLALGILQVLIFAIYKKRNSFFSEAFSDISLFLNRIVIDRILIESIAIFVFVFCFIELQKRLKIKYPNDLTSLVIYNLKSVPIVMIALLVFTPLGILLRYLWRKGIVIDERLLLQNLGNLKGIYLQTLMPYMVVSLSMINLNLAFQKRRKELENSNIDIPNNVALEVINENGNTIIDASDILWIEKNARVYEIKTSDRVYFIRKTLSELEKLLVPIGFLRINRGVLANKKYIHNYSFWEFDKFILRMKDEKKTEFIVSRNRIKQLKKEMQIVLK